VLADVPRTERCRCGEKSASARTSGFKVTPKASTAPIAPQGKLRGWLSK
jgi:hypothetical protein